MCERTENHTPGAKVKINSLCNQDRWESLHRSPRRWGPCIKPWYLWISNATNGHWKLINSVSEGAVLMNREQGSHNLIVQTCGTFCPKSKWCQTDLQGTYKGKDLQGKEKIKLGFIIIICVAILSSGKKEQHNCTANTFGWGSAVLGGKGMSDWKAWWVSIWIHHFHILEKLKKVNVQSECERACVCVHVHAPNLTVEYVVRILIC